METVLHAWSPASSHALLSLLGRVQASPQKFRAFPWDVDLTLCLWGSVLFILHPKAPTPEPFSPGPSCFHTSLSPYPPGALPHCPAPSVQMSPVSS